MGVCENKQLIFAAKVKNGFVPRIRDEIFRGLKALRTAECPFKNLPETRTSRWGESLTAEKNGSMQVGQNTEANMQKMSLQLDKLKSRRRSSAKQQHSV